MSKPMFPVGFDVFNRTSSLDSDRPPDNHGERLIDALVEDSTIKTKKSIDALDHETTTKYPLHYDPKDPWNLTIGEDGIILFATELHSPVDSIFDHNSLSEHDSATSLSENEEELITSTNTGLIYDHDNNLHCLDEEDISGIECKEFGIEEEHNEFIYLPEQKVEHSTSIPMIVITPPQDEVHHEDNVVPTVEFPFFCNSKIAETAHFCKLPSGPRASAEHLTEDESADAAHFSQIPSGPNANTEHQARGAITDTAHFSKLLSGLRASAEHPDKDEVKHSDHLPEHLSAHNASVVGSTKANSTDAAHFSGLLSGLRASAKHSVEDVTLRDEEEPVPAIAEEIFEGSIQPQDDIDDVFWAHFTKEKEILSWHILDDPAIILVSAPDHDIDLDEEEIDDDEQFQALFSKLRANAPKHVDTSFTKSANYREYLLQELKGTKDDQDVCSSYNVFCDPAILTIGKPQSNAEATKGIDTNDLRKHMASLIAGLKESASGSTDVEDEYSTDFVQDAADPQEAPHVHSTVPDGGVLEVKDGVRQDLPATTLVEHRVKQTFLLASSLSQIVREIAFHIIASVLQASFWDILGIEPVSMLTIPNNYMPVFKSSNPAEAISPKIDTDTDVIPAEAVIEINVRSDVEATKLNEGTCATDQDVKAADNFEEKVWEQSLLDGYCRSSDLQEASFNDNEDAADGFSIDQDPLEFHSSDDESDRDGNDQVSSINSDELLADELLDSAEHEENDVQGHLHIHKTVIGAGEIENPLVRLTIDGLAEFRQKSHAQLLQDLLLLFSKYGIHAEVSAFSATLASLANDRSVGTAMNDQQEELHRKQFTPSKTIRSSAEAKPGPVAHVISGVSYGTIHRHNPENEEPEIETPAEHTVFDEEWVECSSRPNDHESLSDFFTNTVASKNGAAYLPTRVEPEVLHKHKVSNSTEASVESSDTEHLLPRTPSDSSWEDANRSKNTTKNTIFHGFCRIADVLTRDTSSSSSTQFNPEHIEAYNIISQGPIHAAYTSQELHQQSIPNSQPNVSKLARTPTKVSPVSKKTDLSPPATPQGSRAQSTATSQIPRYAQHTQSSAAKTKAKASVGLGHSLDAIRKLLTEESILPPIVSNRIQPTPVPIPTSETICEKKSVSSPTDSTPGMSIVYADVPLHASKPYRPASMTPSWYDL